MKFRMDQAQRLYSQPDASAYTDVEIALGEEVEIGSEVKRNGVGFCPVRRRNGQSGYIPGNTRGGHIKPMTIDQNEVVVYAQPSTGSPERTRLRKGARIWLFPGVVETGGVQFVQIRNAQGIEGFMSGETRAKRVVEVTRQVAMKNMLVGGLWCVGGLVATSISNFYFFGAVVFGAIQFFKGLGQLVSAPV